MTNTSSQRHITFPDCDSGATPATPEYCTTVAEDFATPSGYFCTMHSESVPPALSSGRVFPCTQCGASLRFLPSVGKLTCPNCGTENDRPAASDTDVLESREELDYLGFLRAQAGNEPEITPQLVECPQCGAQTQFDAHVVAAVCAFCATPLVASSALADRRIKPRAVVPFSIETKQAQTVFRKWIHGLWFAPNALRKTVNAVQGVRGVYLPCWTFDANTVSDYQGQRGIDRIVQETRRDADGRTVIVHRTVTDWYFASGTVYVDFDDTLVPASHSIPKHLAQVLRGWDISGMVPFSDEYVAGFTVEAYQTALEPAFAEAKSEFDAAIDRAVRRDIGGNHQRVHHINSRYNNVTFKHILLPAWICSYQFRGKAWRVVVNGQTGEVRGDRPWSAWKIAFAILAAIAAGVVIYMVSQQ